MVSLGIVATRTFLFLHLAGKERKRLGMALLTGRVQGDWDKAVSRFPSLVYRSTDSS